MRKARLQYRANPKTITKLKLLAKSKKITLTDILTEIVEDYLKEVEPVIELFTNMDIIQRKDTNEI